MSTSLAYHTQGIKGFQHKSFDFSEKKLLRRFVKIQESINPEILWRISYHSNNDISRLQQRCRDLKINKYELFRV